MDWFLRAWVSSNDLDAKKINKNWTFFFFFLIGGAAGKWDKQ